VLSSKACILAAACVLIHSLVLWSSSFATESANQDSPPIVSYFASQEHGNVRVTLLSVSRSSSFLKAPGKQANAPTFEARPTVRIVYLVEKLDAGPPKSRDTGPAELTGPKGEPALTEIPYRLGDTVMTERSSRDSYHDYNPNGTDYLPPVADPKRAFVTVHWVHRAAIKTSRLRLTLHEGFDGRSEVFRFENIPAP
jgi:hypothetical protein